MPEPGDNNREKQIFGEALEIASEPERIEFVNQACGGDAALLARVLMLLLAHKTAAGFLPEAPRGPGGTVRIDFPAMEEPGDRLGRYKLLQRIGEGGCGVVYMAEQEEPVRRRVALKVIKLGMDTRDVIARFEQERQALALMDHPNIAKVLDGGATESGRPFFVMELVRGLKITDYCDQNNLTMAARLELFAQVCRAVQHAHQKGIIHRDIKPSNILVTLSDEAPIPKVIDFGIAKATQGKLTDNTVFTAFEQFIGTPAYMSPEQAELGVVDIDTRSDIYSLGVLLYELLTGATPFDARELLRAGLDEMRRQIREKEPPKPSTKLSSLLRADLTTVAARRRAAPPKLLHELRGDLDWIVMKCLEKDRARRYETANGLALDIERHLRSEPVTAVAPGAWYRTRKFVRRHRKSVLAAALVLFAMTGGIVGTTWGLLAALRAKKEAQRQGAIARHTTDFLTNMFESIDPAVAQRREITVREILDTASQTVGTNSPGEPLVELPLRRTIGEIYVKLGRDDLALPQAQAAVQLARSAHGNRDHLDTAASLEAVADSLADLGRLDEAVAAYNTVVDMFRRLEKGDSPDLATALDNRALCLAMRWVECRRPWRISKRPSPCAGGCSRGTTKTSPQALTMSASV